MYIEALNLVGHSPTPGSHSFCLLPRTCFAALLLSQLLTRSLSHSGLNMNLNDIYSRVRDLELPPFDPFDVAENVNAATNNPRSCPSNWEFLLDLNSTASKGLQLALSKAAPTPFVSRAKFGDDSLWKLPFWGGGLLTEEETKIAKECLDQQKVPIHALIKIAEMVGCSSNEGKSYEIPADQLPDGLVQGLKWKFESKFCKLCPAGKMWIPTKMLLCGPGAGKIDTRRAFKVALRLCLWRFFPNTPAAISLSNIVKRRKASTYQKLPDQSSSKLSSFTPTAPVNSRK